MNTTRIISFCSALETKLDACLFRAGTDDDQRRSATPRTTDPATIAKGAAGVGAAGAAYLGHRKIMTDYGADGSAGVREAYRNAGRDAARTVRETAGNQVEAARGALNTAKQRATAGVQAGRVSWGRNAAQGKDLLTKIKRAGRAFVGQTVMRR
jgi:hypothetical protein